MKYIPEIRHTGRIWLNGEFGVSRVRETPFLLQNENDYHCPIHKEVMRSLIDAWGISDVLNWVLSGKGASDRIGSSKVTKSLKTSKPRGTKGLTRWGGRMLRNSIYLLEKEAGKDCLSFLTLTVPDCSLEDYKRLAMDWALVTKQLLQRLSQRLQSRQLKGEVVGVSEVQQERFERSGIPALHLHLLFQGRSGKKSAWVITPKWVRKAWKRIIQPYLPSATQWNALENLQRIKKSAGAYMAKYMSKGVDVIERIIESGLGECLPKAWWNCTFSLRRRVLSLSPSGVDVGRVIVRTIDAGDWSLITYLFPIRLEHPLVGMYTIGYGGKFDMRLSDYFRECIMFTRNEIKEEKAYLTRPV